MSVDSQEGAAGNVDLDEFQLDEGFNTFEYSQTAQILKLLLLIGFVMPLLVFEKMRGDEGKNILLEKRNGVQSVQEIKTAKEEELKSYVGLKDQKRVLRLRETELRAVKSDRLMAVQSVDALQSTVPDGVWLLGIRFTLGGLEVTGQTLDETGLDTFVQKLKNSKRFSNINVPKDVKIKSSAGRTVNEFLVTFTVDDQFLESEEVL